MKRVRIVSAFLGTARRRCTRSVGLKLGLLVIAFMIVGSLVYFSTEYQGSTYGAALRDVIVLLVSGFDADTPKTPVGTISALSLLVLGVIFVSVLTSEIAAAAVQRRLGENNGTRQASWRNHILICGWDERVDHLVRQLHSKDLGERVPIVIITDALDSNPYDDELVEFVRGDPTDEEILKRANVHHASRAIILTEARSGDATSQDAKAILTGLAVEAVAPDVSTCVEIINPENGKHLRYAKVDQIICPRLLSDALLVHGTVHPGVPQLVQGLLSFGAGNEIYRCPVPRAADGKTYGNLAEKLFREDEVTVVAVEQDGSITPNADRSLQLREGDHLFVLAKTCPTLTCDV